MLIGNYKVYLGCTILMIFCIPVFGRFFHGDWSAFLAIMVYGGLALGVPVFAIGLIVSGFQNVRGKGTF